MESPYQDILKIIEIAEKYLQIAKSLDPKSQLGEIVDYFIALIYIERLIDKQRVLVEYITPGASFDFHQDKVKVEKRLNQTLRSGIADLVSIIGKDKAREILRPVGENIKLGFVS